MGGGKNGHEGIKEKEFTSRKSPRIPGRKVREKRMENKSTNRSEPRLSRKRKQGSYEDDPSYSEGEDGDANNDHQKKVPGYRCSPHLIPELMEQLCPKQLEWVEKIGFIALKDMIGSRSPKSLTMWLVEHVDTTHGTINVCGKPVDIRKGVKRLLQLPSGDKKVPQPLNGRAKAKIQKAGASRADDKHSDHGRGQSAKEAMKILLAEKEDEVAFCQSFVMLVLCIYLAPTTSLNINRSYFPALMDVSQISLLDWCGFIGDYLVNGIEEFRKSKASHVQVPGCVHLLPLLYLDALIKGKALVLPEALRLPEGEPRIHYITSEHLAFLASADIKSKSKDCVEYGLLQESIIGSKEVDGSSSSSGPTNREVGKDSTFKPRACVEVNASELLDSMFKEIKDGRDKLVNEFHRKIVEAEEKTFCRFKSKFLKCLKISESTPPIETNPDQHKGDAGCSENRYNCRDQCEQEKQNLDDINGEDQTDSAQCKQISPEEALVPKSGNERPSQAKSRPANETCWPHGGSTVVMPNIGIDVQKVQDSNAVVIDDVDGGRPRDDSMDLDCAQHDEPGSRSNLDRLEDELEEVANIGREAAKEAKEACCNDQQGLGEITAGKMLSVLSDAAVSEGPPKFDRSPDVRYDLTKPTDITVSTEVKSGRRTYPSATYQLACNLSSNNTPIYDKSPMTPTKQDTIETMESRTLESIPEKWAGSKDEDTSFFPGRLLRAAAETGGIGVMSSANAPENQLLSSPTETEHNEIAAEEESSTQSGESLSGESDGSDSGDYEESGEIPSAVDDEAKYDEQPLETSPDFPLTPSYTFNSVECITIPDASDSPSPLDIIHIPPLDKEIEFGFRFKVGCSVSSSTGKLYESFNQMGSNDNRMEDIGKFKFVLCKHASETYKMHVSNSSARLSKRLRHVPNPKRDGTKIQIKGFHISKGDFVDAMKPNGEVCQNLMGLCSVAIMADWETNKRVILDQGTIRELMREGHVCSEMKVLAKMKKLPLEDLEEMFLPMLTSNHWILVVVNVLNGTVELYDSILGVDEGDHPHKKIWDTVAANLEHGYSTAVRKTVKISRFRCKYPRVKQQANLHDCGFHVIQALECYNSKDVVGRDEKKTMMPYRKYLSHLLIYHRFNDLNPLREGINVESP